jgi:hypothetical protein
LAINLGSSVVRRRTCVGFWKHASPLQCPACPRSVHVLLGRVTDALAQARSRGTRDSFGDFGVWTTLGCHVSKRFPPFKGSLQGSLTTFAGKLVRLTSSLQDFVAFARHPAVLGTMITRNKPSRFYVAAHVWGGLALLERGPHIREFLSWSRRGP